MVPLMKVLTWRFPTKNGLPSLSILLLLGAVISILLLTAPVVEINLGRLWLSLGKLFQFLLNWLTIPDWAYLPKLAAKLLETVQIAIFATFLSLFFSIPVGILAANNTTPHPLIYHLSRNLMSFIRALPELVWALVFVSALGMGALPGVMALTFVTTGFLGKLVAESLEVVDIKAISGVQATGANWLQILLFAIFPQALPDLIATLLYVLDHNIRAATILGIVGAGGIGFDLVESIRLFNYSRLMLIILAIYLLVNIFDRCSDMIRDRII
ncbi:MAG: phosphonate ABC transporter, permease protein PhnE [Calothrix sp. MO_192.B10]|nr:phosphonate ABC transporter, permease protein PhnE [Calothrix sp. MO_192.B10]